MKANYNEINYGNEFVRYAYRKFLNHPLSESLGKRLRMDRLPTSSFAMREGSIIESLETVLMGGVGIAVILYAKDLLFEGRFVEGAFLGTAGILYESFLVKRIADTILEPPSELLDR
ncbi:hypothetical protein A3F00_04275 [Candidatus Daviesbacteria bacterium RIFCSPHIGHO2_12_FULL_37_11]|uniref:Uncharacterized protein n=1 Tax=Candidatus Daviesbacteria bacterium RIFCSPHIGHO2_12_FULL_37_11 TaxID=1797777 RepID=A0A1F5KAK2_9BACT|nr:MAG: hypothetical protein A2111_02600 [Candidatus Daviesbacteria bacterium GWA1_38_6]OGE16117.1 MAG: hypothetical protein A2769_03445 [Candidatus Daviesbacteria bacterium RIFCSPHIGHO2_01_FULL_37_27]OGE37641.1 MAG: hypothetical protein A3F00_04275 [Candidatus Daviesbacteria bacterium RIFCSPHIGHO2_12_FULL_37_11]OGE45398.1 MAG: hypothetical protein A3B39_04675 [Candidatus Daviesbacteria bacterium RIFCSPLOWO2_01_FULL_37_10]